MWRAQLVSDGRRPAWGRSGRPDEHCADPRSGPRPAARRGLAGDYGEQRMKGRRPSGLTFKVGEDRLRVPPGLTHVTVRFGGEPITKMLFKRFKAEKVMVRGTIVDPPELAGRTLAGFYPLPPNGTLGGGSRLMRDSRTLHGRPLAEGESFDPQDAFAGRTALVALRLVTPKDGSGTYAVLDYVVRRVK